MILAIEFTLGLTYLIVGLSCILRPVAWMGWLEKTRAGGEQSAVLLGMVGLMICAFIVAGHPVYSGPPLLITLFGLTGIIESTIYLLFPRTLGWVLGFFTGKARMFRLLGLVSVILGVIILLIWSPYDIF